jgi:hypothetical protein
MVSWLVDHAGLVYLSLASTALVLGSSWWMTRRKRYLIGLGVVAALCVLVFVVTRLVVTDRQQIERNLRAMALGVVDAAPGKFFPHLSKQFHLGTLDRAAFLPRAEKAIVQHQVKDVHLWKIDVEELDREAKKARVSFNARVTSDWTESTQFFLVRADFVLEDGQWRMTTFQLFNPVVNTNQPVPIPLP